MKFRKKPVVIDAVQFTGDNHIPGVCEGECVGRDNCAPHIHTLEGDMSVSLGDFIITGVKGERYPCKPDIFAATYDAVDVIPPAPDKCPKPAEIDCIAELKKGLEKCPKCGGSGNDPSFDYLQYCPACHGTGKAA